ncbi:MFS transporter [Salinibacterium sp. NSLL150]|uniref:MFS transporter n=1 Tax=unclassified Salinibacterium TaxID=2632331 RepID=UPI0018CDD20B|nr:MULTISPECIES: MFS transporter [unclassified Salinibacterium]MBH0024591.1 MFS transporter [Salinibacterium sp. SWN248]MBH0099535.1 MFS transporter [Salinibacterium sp. NSLL35]MBH0102289.1 MFS transporter [Salinibacterium sp. NSLL150]MBH0105049.1 MFS transporter [Salinibacterium sp. NSLL16]MBH0107809.1 MFS transporter [Salinibacterium sp. NSLL17]
MTTAAPRALTRSSIATYAIGSLGTGGFGALPGLVLVYYLTDTLGIAALAAGILVTAAKVWDVIIDPVIGARSDRSLAHRGTRRPAMLVGAILLPILFVVTFAVPAGIGPLASGIWVFIAFVATATAFSLFQVPYIALPAELTRSYDERTRLLAVRVVVLTVAILLFGAGAPEIRDAFADERLGYLVMALSAAALMGVSLVISSFSAPTGTMSVTPTVSIVETYRAGVAALKRSQPFRALLLTFLLQGLATGVMLAGAQYVATWVLGTGVAILFVSLIGPALLFAPVWAAISRRIGKERAFVWASACYGLGALLIVPQLWAPGAWIYAPVALAGAGYAGMQALPMSMLPDVISHDSRRHKLASAGTFGGVWTAGETTGMALGATVLTTVLAASGYLESVANQTVAQPDSAIAGIIISFSIVPAVIIGLSLLTFRRYPLRRSDIDHADAEPHPTSGPTTTSNDQETR